MTSRELNIPQLCIFYHKQMGLSIIGWNRSVPRHAKRTQFVMELKFQSTAISSHALSSNWLKSSIPRTNQHMEKRSTSIPSLKRVRMDFTAYVFAEKNYVIDIYSNSLPCMAAICKWRWENVLCSWPEKRGSVGPRPFARTWRPPLPRNHTP